MKKIIKYLKSNKSKKLSVATLMTIFVRSKTARDKI